jgi:hypothetical protein
MRVRSYNNKTTRRPFGQKGWGMNVIRNTIVATAAVLFLSCVDNEISFFIEHAKIQPEGPDCTASASDEVASSGLIDVMFRKGFSNTYLITNQLMSQEDYDNVKAETNGILIDAFDVSITTTDTNENIGVSERIPSQDFLEPESSDVAEAVILSSDLVEEMANAAGCLRRTAENYPAESMFQTTEPKDRNGNPVPRGLGTVNTGIRFYGHTQGGKAVQTQRFIFPIRLCCGCLVNWYFCNDPCERYCTEGDGFEDDKMCVLGIENGDSLFDCRKIYNNIGQDWPCMIENPNGTDPPLVRSTCTCPLSC